MVLNVKAVHLVEQRTRSGSQLVEGITLRIGSEIRFMMTELSDDLIIWLGRPQRKRPVAEEKEVMKRFGSCVTGQGFILNLLALAA